MWPSLDRGDDIKWVAILAAPLAFFAADFRESTRILIEVEKPAFRVQERWFLDFIASSVRRMKETQNPTITGSGSNLIPQRSSTRC